jgi:hypothetical protein
MASLSKPCGIGDSLSGRKVTATMSAGLPVDFTSTQIGSLAGPPTPFRLPSSVLEATLHVVVPEFDFKF